MNENDMKKKIKQAYEKQNLDLLSKIETSCQAEKQASPTQGPSNKSFAFSRLYRSVIASVVCFALFLTGLGIGFVIPKDKGQSDSAFDDSIETLVYLDVNPSIELQVNSESKIISCLPANDDAEIILDGLELKGVDMNTALTAIIGSMHVNGYLSSDSNSILVSVNTSSEEKETILLENITDGISKVFKESDMECSIIAQSVEIDDDLKRRAKENGISAGKMHLVDKMIEEIDGFSEDDRKNLSGMSIKELNLMYSTRPKPDDEGHDPFDKDVTSGAIGGYLNDEAVINAILEATELDSENIVKYFVRAKLVHGNEDRNMIYEAKIILKDGKELLFEVDCSTGEIIKLDSSMLPPPEFKDEEKGEHPEMNRPIRFK